MERGNGRGGFGGVFNRQTNNYLAVTGKPGSGKTQFVKDLLAQIRRQSEYQVNFIFFDYAKGDVADDADFVAATRAEVVRLPEESLPVNPFSRVNVNLETAIKVAAQEFADHPPRSKSVWERFRRNCFMTRFCAGLKCGAVKIRRFLILRLSGRKSNTIIRSITANSTR